MTLCAVSTLFGSSVGVVARLEPRGTLGIHPEES